MITNEMRTRLIQIIQYELPQLNQDLPNATSMLRVHDLLKQMTSILDFTIKCLIENDKETKDLLEKTTVPVSPIAPLTPTPRHREPQKTHLVPSTWHNPSPAPPSKNPAPPPPKPPPPPPSPPSSGEETKTPTKPWGYIVPNPAGSYSPPDAVRPGDDKPA